MSREDPRDSSSPRQAASSSWLASVAGVAHTVRMFRIYLCGAISGRTDREISAWRLRATEILRPHAEVWDATAYPIDRTRADASEAASDPIRLHHGQTVVERDRAAVRESHLVLANFAGVSEASVGGIGELFWANAFGIPIVLVRDRRSIYNHSMLVSIASAVFDDLESALGYILSLRGAGQHLPEPDVGVIPSVRGEAGDSLSCGDNPSKGEGTSIR